MVEARMMSFMRVIILLLPWIGNALFDLGGRGGGFSNSAVGYAYKRRSGTRDRSMEMISIMGDSNKYTNSTGITPAETDIGITPAETENSRRTFVVGGLAAIAVLTLGSSAEASGVTSKTDDFSVLFETMSEEILSDEMFGRLATYGLIEIIRPEFMPSDGDIDAMDVSEHPEAEPLTMASLHKGLHHGASYYTVQYCTSGGCVASVYTHVSGSTYSLTVKKLSCSYCKYCCY